MASTGVIDDIDRHSIWLLSALAFGALDSLISFASRTINSLHSMVLAQAVSVLLLGEAMMLGTKQGFPLPAGGVLPLLLVGVGVGAVNSLANLSLYKGLELGPVALVSPIAAAYGLITTLLSICFLHDPLTWEESIAVALVLGGVIFCSIDGKTWKLFVTRITDRRYLTSFMPVVLLAMTIGLLLSGVLMVMGAASQLVLSLGVGEGALVLAAVALALLPTGKPLPPLRLQAWRTHLLQKRLGLLCGLGAMAGFGIEFFSLSIATKAMGPEQPLLWSWLLSAVFLFLYASKKRIRGWGDIPLKYFALIVLIGALDIVGMWCYDLGTRLSATRIVASLSSTYTLLPIFVGVVIYRERLALVQWLSLGALCVRVVLLGLTGK